jgi:hypothetical protein
MKTSFPEMKGNKMNMGINKDNIRVDVLNILGLINIKLNTFKHLLLICSLIILMIPGGDTIFIPTLQQRQL